MPSDFMQRLTRTCELSTSPYSLTIHVYHASLLRQRKHSPPYESTCSVMTWSWRSSALFATPPIPASTFNAQFTSCKSRPGVGLLICLTAHSSTTWLQQRDPDSSNMHVCLYAYVSSLLVLAHFRLLQVLISCLIFRTLFLILPLVA